MAFVDPDAPLRALGPTADCAASDLTLVERDIDVADKRTDRIAVVYVWVMRFDAPTGVAMPPRDGGVLMPEQLTALHRSVRACDIWFCDRGAEFGLYLRSERSKMAAACEAVVRRVATLIAGFGTAYSCHADVCVGEPEARVLQHLWHTASQRAPLGRRFQGRHLPIDELA